MLNLIDMYVCRIEIGRSQIDKEQNFK
jgi:hypothetical protein